MEDINVLINKSRLEKRIDELAEEIQKDYQGKSIVLLGVLKGAVPFMWELAKRIKNDVELEFLLEHLKEKKPNSIKIATLLSKPSRRVIELNVDYIGFKIDDKFVVGYGLDYDQNLRNLPYIGYIE